LQASVTHEIVIMVNIEIFAHGIKIHAQGVLFAVY